MHQSHRLALALLVASSSLLLNGCFKRTVSTPNGSVDVSDDEKTVNVTTSEGTATFSGAASLPAGFPSTVPTPAFGTITSSYAGSDTENAGFNVMYTLAVGEAESASSRYQEQLKSAGYTVEGAASTDAGGTKLDVFSAKKDGNQVGVTVSRLADGTATMNLAVTTGNAE